MKKTLIAAAMLSLFSGAAFAADNVTLYGVVDLGVAHYDNGGQTVTNLSQGGVSNSRIGLKGKEDLGGGLNAIFQAETGYCANGGYGGNLSSGGFCSGGLFMGRQSWVGLEGGFGKFRMGRIYTYSDDDLYDFDPFTDNTVAEVGNIVETWVPVRLSQTIAYDSPSLSGFDFGAKYTFGDGLGLTSGTATKTTGGYGLRARYLNGPVRVSAETTRVNNISGQATVNDMRISGAYDFGILSLRALYGENRPDDSAINATTQNATSSIFKAKYYMVGIAVPVGPGSILASYTHVTNDTIANAGAKQYGIGYWYNLSKQTMLYANYARISNDANAMYTVGVGNDAPNGPNGSTSSGLMLGIKHSF